MELSEKRIDIAHRLYRCRKTAKNLLGEQYQAKMAEYKVLIREWMPRFNNEVLEAVLAMAECIKEHVFGTIFLMAAAVEMIENEDKRPSEGKEGKV
jgi:hypothetical protein